MLPLGVIGWIKQRVLQTIRICDVAERRAAISVVAVVAPVASLELKSVGLYHTDCTGLHALAGEGNAIW